MENYVYLIIAEADCPLNIVWRQQKNVCQYSKKKSGKQQGLTELTLFRANVRFGWQNDGRDEK